MKRRTVLVTGVAVLLVGRETGADNRFAMLRGHEVIDVLGPEAVVPTEIIS